MSASFRPREKQIVQGLWDGLSQQQVAARLGLSCKTVRNYLDRVRARNGATTTIDLLRKAMQQGVLIP